MNSPNSAGQNGLSDLAYDLVTIMHNKAKAIRAYETYIGDAQKASSQECAQLMQRIHEDDLRHLEELKLHVAAVLTGGPMPGQGQGPSQNRGSSQSQGQGASQSQGQGSSQSQGQGASQSQGQGSSQSQRTPQNPKNG